jgi:hypothetical protein
MQSKICAICDTHVTCAIRSMFHFVVFDVNVIITFILALKYCTLNSSCLCKNNNCNNYSNNNNNNLLLAIMI